MSVRDKIILGKKLTPAEFKREWNRGYKFQVGVLRNYRSLWIEGDMIYGYTKSGSKHKMYHRLDASYTSKKDPFIAGSAKALREALKAKPKRTVRRRASWW